MALIVEDGTGKSDAESYRSVADTDTYFAKHRNPSTWLKADTEDKEDALRRASQYLDLHYGHRLLGSRTNETQALAWPRSSVWDRDGFAIDDDAIPTKWKDATSEAALRALAGDLFEDVDEPGTVKREKVKVGPLSEDIEYSGGKSSAAEYPIIDRLVADFVEDGGRVYLG